MSKFVVVRLAGLVGKRQDMCDTLDMLRLRQKFACVVVNDTPSIRGMLQKIQTWITYGTITDETYKKLVSLRGEKIEQKSGEKTKSSKETKESIKPFFRLHPPRKGFERKGTKQPFAQGGAYGDRGEAMDALIQRMI